MKKNIVIYSTIVTLFLISFVIFFPVFKNSFKIKEQNKKQRLILAKINDKLGKLEAIDENQIKERVRLVEDIFPSQKPVLNLMNSLEYLSGEEDVVFGGLTLKPGNIGISSDKNKRQNFKISFKIEGKLSNISSFISALEKVSPLMKIENLSLTMKNQDEEEQENFSLLTAAFDVLVFYQPMPKIMGAIDKPLAMLSDKEEEVLKTISSYRVFPHLEQSVPMGKENFFLLP